MPNLYYQADTENHASGEYACTCSRAVCDLALERNPGRFMYIEDVPEDITGISFLGIDLAIGGTDNGN